nr:hypothetical protein [Bacillus altitudinis]
MKQKADHSSNQWDDQEAYKEKANFLANEFKKNFKKFSHAASDIEAKGGPLV